MHGIEAGIELSTTVVDTVQHTLDKDILRLPREEFCSMVLPVIECFFKNLTNWPWCKKYFFKLLRRFELKRRRFGAMNDNTVISLKPIGRGAGV